MPKKAAKSAPPPFTREVPEPPRQDLVQAIAAIDIGSNAMRLLIGNVNRAGELNVVEARREPVRLGKDAFTVGHLSEETVERLLAAFHGFKEKIHLHGVRVVRAVATSAMREVDNRDLVVERVAHETGIDIEIIGGEEEARLISLAVAGVVDLRNKLAMLIDIGGGSVEVTLVRNGEILAAESFRMGTVRLIERFRRQGIARDVFHQQVREYIDVSRVWLGEHLQGAQVDVCVGTGGNCEALADLAVTLGSPPGDMSAADLDTILEHLMDATYDERMLRFGLRPDRADVIIPAALVLQQLLRLVHADRLQVPRVGLKDGVIGDMIPDLLANKRHMHRDEVVSSALRFGSRYHFDEVHGLVVARHAVAIFDQTQKQHHLDEEARLLLEVAALLHDIGLYVNISGHHKHTQYLISATPVVGLSEQQRQIIANVARYHRRSAPAMRHEAYSRLLPRDRLMVTKLAAILRVADALDAEHAGKVSEVRVDFKRPRMQLRIRGEGDLLLEKWAVGRKAPLFEEVFGVNVTVD